MTLFHAIPFIVIPLYIAGMIYLHGRSHRDSKSPIMLVTCLVVLICGVLIGKAHASVQYVDGNGEVIGTVAGPYNVGASNDKVEIAIDGGGSQTFTLTHGATQTCAQVIADINATITGGAAYCSRTFVRIRSNTFGNTNVTGGSSGSSVQVLAPANNANTLLGFTATTYYGCGTDASCTFRVNTTALCDTIAHCITNVENVLTGNAGGLHGVGWVCISCGGSDDTMRTAFTPPGSDLCAVIHLKTNAGSDMEVTLENCQGTLKGTSSTTAGGMILPAGGLNIHVVANKYQTFLYTSSVTGAHGFVYVGTIALPTFLNGVTTDAGIMCSNSVSEASATNAYSFRTGVGCGNASNQGNENVLYNGTLWQINNASSSGHIGSPQLVYTQSGDTAASPDTLWTDGRANIADALIGFHQSSPTAGGSVRGQLWDAFVGTSNVAADTSVCTTDHYNAISISDNNVGSGGSFGAGTLFIITAGPGSC